MALGVLSWLGVTGLPAALCELGWSAAKIVATKPVQAHLQDIHQRAAGRLALPTNHDLLKGIRTAHLTALDKIARRHAATVPALPSPEAASGEHQFSNQIRPWLDDRLGFIRAGQLDYEMLTEEQVRRVLDDMVHPTDVEGLAEGEPQSRAFTERDALDELTRDCGPPSPLFIRVFAGETEPGWYEVFALYINEQIKTNERFRSIFFAAELIDAKRLVEAADRRIDDLASRGVESILDEVGAMLRLVQTIKDDTIAIRAMVETLTHHIDLTKQNRDALSAELVRIRSQFDITTTLLTGFLKNILGKDVPPDQFASTLFELAAGWKSAGQYLDAVSVSRNLSPRVADLRLRAQDAHKTERVDDLRMLLAEIERIEQEAIHKLEAYLHDATSELEMRRAGLAETKMAQASLAVAQLRAADAARLYVEAIQLTHTDPAARQAALSAKQDEVYVEGRDKGINFSLEIAIAIAELLVKAADTPDRRGAALNDLANALTTLGERRSDTKQLEQAVAAAREALDEHPRGTAPLAWAKAQNSLGNSLSALGEREVGNQRLEQAVEAYRSALGERTRELVPLDWAATQNNLGAALKSLGEREHGVERLERAVEAYRDALKECTRERAPIRWAVTQNNLGAALKSLGEREHGTERLEQAVEAFRHALTERTRERAPVGWAMTQNNLGSALSLLGERESRTERMEQAVEAYLNALTERTRDRFPLAWAMTTGNMGVTLSLLADRTGNAEMAERAIQHIEAAYAAMLESGHEPFAAYCKEQLPAARAVLDRIRKT